MQTVERSQGSSKQRPGLAAAPSVPVPLPGVLVVGGDHPGLAVARSLGRRGIPVWIIDDQFCISKISRYASRVIRVPNVLDERMTVDAVLSVGRQYSLQGWILVPTRDETVAALSRHRDELAELFTVTTGIWDSVQWAWDKKKTYDLAESLGIPCPKTFHPASAADLPGLSHRLPLAIKPAVKENFFYATGAKAWRADTPEQLKQLYEGAARQIRAEEILIQEIIPGGGQEQYSWCAFAKGGKPQSVLCARRLRQHPREFGRAATYVETVDAPEIEQLSERFIDAISYDGLIEIEYKRDPRDGEYKLLDANARAWGFHGLGAACGIDFSWLLYADCCGITTTPVRAPAGKGWLRLLTDIPTAISDLVYGSLTFGEYFRSLRATATESVFDWSDPLPWAAEFAMLPMSILKKYPVFSRKKA
jgi:predicted ATP-grasp superfamily ATP-dependent carboligase